MESKVLLTFEGDRGRSIVETTVLTVLKVCSQDDTYPTDTVVSILNNAQKILQAVPGATIQGWAGLHRSVVRKLVQKISRPGTPKGLQSGSLGVLVELDPTFEQEERLDLIKGIIRQMTVADCRPTDLGVVNLDGSWKLLADTLKSLMSRTVWSVDRHSELLDCLRSLASFLFERVHPGLNVSVHHAMCLRHAFSAATDLMSQGHHPESRLSETLVQIIDEIVLPDWWALDLHTPGTPENCNGAAVCFHSYEVQRQGLCRELSLLIAEIASTRAMNVTSSNFALIRQRLSIKPSTSHPVLCLYPRLMGSCYDVDGAKQLCSSHEWQNDLKKRLSALSDHTADLAEDFICDITKDLQDRCDNVEVPLREARMEKNHYQKAFKKATEELKETRASSLAIKGTLNFERQSLEHANGRIEEMQREMSGLQQQYEQCQHALAKLNGQMQQEVTNHQLQLNDIRKSAEADAAEVKHINDLKSSEYEDQLSDMERIVTALTKENEWLREEIDRSLEESDSKHQQEFAHMRQEHTAELDADRNHIRDLELKLSSKEKEIQCHTEELQQARGDIKQLTQARDEAQLHRQEVNLLLELRKAEVTELRKLLAQEQSKAEALQRDKVVADTRLERQAQRTAELEISEAS